MQISIVVPVLNEAARIPRLFENVERLRADSGLSIELIIVDGGSTDETVELARHANVFLESDAGRARQMNHGAARAGGELLVFLHADTLLPLEMAKEWQTMLGQNSLWGYAPVRLDDDAVSFRIIEWCMNTRSRMTRIATGDQVLCVNRQAFKHGGGYASIDLMEDVELSARLRKQQQPLFFGCKVQCSARKWLKHGIAKTILLMWAIRTAYFFGVSPARLHAYYYGKS